MTLSTIDKKPRRRMPFIAWFFRGNGTHRIWDRTAALQEEVNRLRAEAFKATTERDQVTYRLTQVTYHLTQVMNHRDGLQEALDVALAANEANRVRFTVPAAAGPVETAPTYEFIGYPTWTDQDDQAAWTEAEAEIVTAEIVEDETVMSLTDLGFDPSSPTFSVDFAAATLGEPEPDLVIPPLPPFAPEAHSAHSYQRGAGMTRVSSLSDRRAATGTGPS
jgi:hypothetical protein